MEKCDANLIPQITCSEPRMEIDEDSKAQFSVVSKQPLRLSKRWKREWTPGADQIDLAGNGKANAPPMEKTKTIDADLSSAGGFHRGFPGASQRLPREALRFTKATSWSTRCTLLMLNPPASPA